MKLSKEHLGCFTVGVVIVAIVIIILTVTTKKSTFTRTDITSCQPHQTRTTSKDSEGNIVFNCKDKENYGPRKYRTKKREKFGGPRACNYNQTTQIRGLPNGAGLLACSDKPYTPPNQSTTAKTMGTEEFVNVGLVPGINCTFKQTSKPNSIFGPQYTCLPVKVNVASAYAGGHGADMWKDYYIKEAQRKKAAAAAIAAQTATESYTPKAYTYRKGARANFMGTNYRVKKKTNFIPSSRNRVGFAGTNYRRENLNGSMSSGESVQQPIGNNRSSCNGRTVYMRRGPSGDLVAECQPLGG
jgi:hypothetical protein